jgi:hypothetical protein
MRYQAPQDIITIATMKFFVSILLITTVVTKAQDIRRRGNVESGGKPNIDYMRDLQSYELVDLSLSLPAVAGLKVKLKSPSCPRQARTSIRAVFLIASQTYAVTSATSSRIFLDVLLYKMTTLRRYALQPCSWLVDKKGVIGQWISLR